IIYPPIQHLTGSQHFHGTTMYSQKPESCVRLADITSVKKLITGGCSVPPASKSVTPEEREGQYWTFVNQAAPAENRTSVISEDSGKVIGLEKALAALPIHLINQEASISNDTFIQLNLHTPYPPPNPCLEAPPVPPKPLSLRDIKLNHVSSTVGKRTRSDLDKMIQIGIKKFRTNNSADEEQHPSSPW
ncbi:hypothetical protein HDV02_005490, partial [Globomyces sp. JEL0801]